MLDPRLIHVVAVARSGSFTAAAEVACITQSAVTKSVADLERQIGYFIFYRTSRGVILTEQGRDFVERAGRLLEEAQDLLKGSVHRGDSYVGVLRIGVCPGSLDWLLIKPLAEIGKRHAGIRFDVSSASFERIVQQLRNGVVDVALGFEGAFSEWPDLQRESAGALDSILFVRKNHPLLQRPSMSVADLAAYNFVSPSDSRPYGPVIRNLYESQGVEWQKRLHLIDYFPIVKSIVATSNTIGVVAGPHARSRHFRTQFETLDGVAPFPRVPLCCAWQARWQPKPAVRALVGAMKPDRAPRSMNARNAPDEE